MTQQELLAVLEATWPAAHTERQGPWILRDGAGGGKRVSATTLDLGVEACDLPLSQDLYRVDEEQLELDARLAADGYDLLDETLLLAVSADLLAPKALPPVSVFDIWEPLSIMCDVWKQGGIGPERMAVMERVTVPKTAFLGRSEGRVAGCGFAAMSDGICMVHAVEVLTRFRRRGTARNIMIAAAQGAKALGGHHICVAVTAENTGAIRLYEGLGMKQVGGYHYRVRNKD